jgi:hypothetical protein
LKAIDGGAEVVLDEVDADHRYRVLRTGARLPSYLITARSRDAVGAVIIAEWLHRTQEAALACAEVARASNMVFRAHTRGVEAGHGIMGAMQRVDR